ncbi:hypothetical protein D1007_53291 [Hordeum vulgare]|nr:hypothetical protein D1007_53291 [Hordeum vulgare]
MMTDEILFPELVDRVSQQAVEDEYAEEPSSRVRFDDTGDEEREDNIGSLVLQEYDGEDMPTIEWNRENPDLTPGTVFESMVDCRNAVTTYCILTNNSYEVDRSDLGRFTVHCPYDRRCSNPVDASFGEEEQWAEANAEEHASAEENAASLEDNAAAEENATSLENEATEVAACSRIIRGTIQKRPREEETSVEPSSDAEFETMVYEGFEAIREDNVILSEVPLKISQPTDDHQLDITCSISQSSTKLPPPEVKIRSNKTKLSKARNIQARETRSKTVKTSQKTRSKAKI